MPSKRWASPYYIPLPATMRAPTDWCSSLSLDSMDFIGCRVWCINLYQYAPKFHRLYGWYSIGWLSVPASTFPRKLKWLRRVVINVYKGVGAVTRFLQTAINLADVILERVYATRTASQTKILGFARVTFGTPWLDYNASNKWSINCISLLLQIHDGDLILTLA